MAANFPAATRAFDDTAAWLTVHTMRMDKEVPLYVKRALRHS
jgi:hypothetical protein